MNKFSFFNTKNKHRYIFTAATIITAVVLSWFIWHVYPDSSKDELKIKAFESTLQKKIEQADAELSNFGKQQHAFDEIKDVSFYIYRNDSLIFWTENKLGIPSNYSSLLLVSPLLELPNSLCVYRQKVHGDSILLAIVKIKNTYAIPNKYLHNDFAASFDMPAGTRVIAGNATDKYTIQSAEGEHLFSLQPATSDNILLSSGIFSPVFFANDIFPSLGHLLIFSLVLLGGLIVFYLKCPPLRRIRNIPIVLKICALELFLFAYFYLFCLLFRNLIFNSSFEITFSYIDNIGLYPLLSLLMVISWFIGFILLNIRLLSSSYFKIKSWKTVFGFAFAILLSFCITLLASESLLIPTCFSLATGIILLWKVKKTPMGLSFLLLMVFVFSLFIVVFSLQNNEQKLFKKHAILAENLRHSGFSNRNPFVEILLEEESEQLGKDKALAQYFAGNISDKEISTYIYNAYLRAFWNNYDIKIFATDSNHLSEHNMRCLHYDSLISQSERIKNAGFYYAPDSMSKINYIGKFSGNSKQIYIELSGKHFLPGYSYPNMLFDKNSNNLGANVAAAYYKNDRLQSYAGWFRFPSHSRWIEQKNDSAFIFNLRDFTHFVYKPGADETIVVTQKQVFGRNVFFTYWMYLFASCLLAVVALYWLSLIVHPASKRQPSSTFARLHLAFQAILIISFLVVLTLSVNYLISYYQKEQNDNLQNKTNYIRQHINDFVGDVDALENINQLKLNEFLYTLSDIYKTDISLYDHNGILFMPSQPVIFSQNLQSNYMSSDAFFNIRRRTYTQTEEIGTLKYLSAYTRIVNSKRETIGYIAVPSFLSMDDIQKEFFKLFAVLLGVYLGIIILASLISLIIERQISKPLKSLAEKLKNISLNENNTRLEYNRNDEIGQLVQQYNQMADKLQESAEKLTQSEREAAWKQMARQIAHEIKNPLTPMKLTIQQLQRLQTSDRELFDEYFRKSSKTLVEQIENLAYTASAFSDFSKMLKVKQEQIEVNACLQSAVNLFENNKKNVAIHYTPYPSQLFIMFDKEQLMRVLNNLLRNALQAIPEERQGYINIETAVHGNMVTIAIRDNGSGIEEHALEKLFEPNFTTKAGGTGLGLAIVKNIMAENNGKVRFETCTEEGSVFFLDFELC